MCMWSHEKAGKRLDIPEGKPLLAYKELSVTYEGWVNSPVALKRWPDAGMKVAVMLLNANDNYRTKASNKGIYSYKEKPRDYTYGEIEIWGDVIEHSTGYRSTHAYLTTIHLSYDRDVEVIEGLRKNYPGSGSTRGARGSTDGA